MLGGKAEFVVERAAAERAYAARPGGLDGVRADARAHRAVLGRIVRYLARGRGQAVPRHRTGIPKEDNVHEVAQREAPESRLVYVDRNPIVLAHADQRRAAGTTAYNYGELSSAGILPRASGSRSRPAFRRPGPSAVSLRRPARLSKTCATSSEAGEHAVVIAQELGPGG